jgi:O-antigen/teichoic acid export membrane protein
MNFGMQSQWNRQCRRRGSVLRRIVGLGRGRTGARFGSTVVANLLATGFGVINGFLLARYLGPTARGSLASVMQPILVLSTIGLLGIPEELIRRDGDRRGFAARSRSTVLLGSALVAGLAVWYVTGLGQGWVVALVAGSIPLTNAVNMLYVSELRSRGQYDLWNAVKLFVAIIPPVVFALSVLLWGASIEWAVASMAIAGTGVTALLARHVLERQEGSWASRRSGTRKFLTPREIGECLPHLAVSLQTSFTERGDVLLLSLSGRDTVTGIYVVAATISAPITSIAAAVTTQTYSEAARGRSLATLGLKSAVGLLVAIAVLAAFAQFALVPLLGEAYRGSIVPAQILLLAAIPSVYRQRTTSLMRACGQKRAAVVIEFITLVATMAPLLVLLQTASPTMAALISLIGYTIGAAVAWLLQRSA